MHLSCSRLSKNMDFNLYSFFLIIQVQQRQLPIVCIIHFSKISPEKVVNTLGEIITI